MEGGVTSLVQMFEADEEARRIRQRKRRLMLVALASIGEDLL